MSIFLLCPDTNVSPDLRISDNGSCNEMIWENGSIIDTNAFDMSRMEFFCESLPSGQMTDYAVSDMGCSVVSDRFKKTLDGFGVDNIQYFKATVIERSGETAKPGYYAANVLGLVDCIDREASDMSADLDSEGETTIIFHIHKLVLKRDAYCKDYIFRPAHFTGLILVSETLKHGILKCSLEGIRFVSPDKWDGFHGEI